ncbi:hypothetical protein G1K97_10405 [Tenacibaculum finnmarkense]|uniref:hypothetical protein n=1 Tax=Tenacibaculum finnmarkense TaxID=2781243 RepID=UPI001EFA8DB2|nr:hypothetical protein [Tenacibaculum finnmarkense]MCG8902250.1 hypothetical protein [Tenacibaculum finnmarkense]
MESIDITTALVIILLIIVDFIYYYKLGSTLSKTTNKTALNFSTFAYTTIVLNLIFIIFSILEFNIFFTGLITSSIPLIFLINGFHIAGRKKLIMDSNQNKIPKSNNKFLVPIIASVSVFLIIYTKNNKIIDKTEPNNTESSINNKLNTKNNNYIQSRTYDSNNKYNNDIKSSVDNRANQLNSNNDSYYKSRGYKSKTSYNNQTKSSTDNRSNQLNPNNSNYSSSRSSPSSNSAASNNRSNQMNPNNSAYKGGK